LSYLFRFNYTIFFSTITRKRIPNSKPTNYWLVLSPKQWSKLSTMILALSSTTTTTPRSTVRLSLWSALLVPYEKGDEVIYNGMKYRCVTSHQSYSGAEPGLLTWALWQKIK